MYIYVLIILSLFLTSCTHSSKFNTDVINISGFNITQYEFEKNLDVYRQNIDITDTANVSLKNWIEGYIDNAYVTKFAYDMGYGNNPIVIEQVQNTARFIITQNHGLLYNEMTKKKKLFSEKDIINSYKKRKTVYNAEIVKFVDYNEFIEVVGADSLLINANIYSNMVKKKDENKISFYNLNFCFPYWELDYYEEYISKLKIAQISKPLYTPWGIYIIKINSIKKEELKPYEVEKGSIENYLIENEKIKIWETYYIETNKKANVEINELLLDSVMKKTNKEQLFIDKTIFKEFLNDIIMKYQENTKINKVTLNDFIDFYNNLIIKKKNIN